MARLVAPVASLVFTGVRVLDLLDLVHGVWSKSLAPLEVHFAEQGSSHLRAWAGCSLESIFWVSFTQVLMGVQPLEARQSWRCVRWDASVPCWLGRPSPTSPCYLLMQTSPPCPPSLKGYSSTYFTSLDKQPTPRFGPERTHYFRCFWLHFCSVSMETGGLAKATRMSRLSLFPELGLFSLMQCLFL